MRRSWISVVLVLPVVVAGVFAQESVTPRPPAAPTLTPIPSPGPPGAPSIKPTPPPAPSVEPTPPRTLAPGSPIPPTPGPVQVAPPTYQPQVPVAATPQIAPSPAPPMQKPVECRRVVYHLRAIPAADAARTLEQLLRTEEKMSGHAARRQMAIVSNTAGNSLLVSGPPEIVDEIGKLIEELDRAPVMVRIEIVIGEVGEKSEKEETQILSRAELTTLDNQPARLQMGRREPRVTGRTVTAKGTMNSMTMEDVGTQVSLTPRVGPDDVVTLEIDVEDSRLGPEEEGAVIATDSEGKTLRMAGTQTLACESTLSIRSGQTVTLAGMGREGGTEKRCVIMVTAEVVNGEGERMKDEG